MKQTIVNKALVGGWLNTNHDGVFKEYYRVLKPNRWMTWEFSNSKNSVWNAIKSHLLGLAL